MVVSGARFILTINLCDSGTQRTVGRFEAKQKLSELVERVSEGEQIGVTKRGKLTALIVPAHQQVNPKEILTTLSGYASAPSLSPKA
jgi:prevent-host-death family protein